MPELSFQLERKHYLEFVWLAQVHALGWSIACGYAFLVYSLIGVVAALIWEASSPAAIQYVGLSTVAALAVLIFFYPRYCAWKFVSSEGAILSPRRLRALENKIEIDGARHQEAYEWKAIRGVSAGKHVLVLWIDRSMGIILPRSVFSTPHEEEAFRAFVVQRIGTGRASASRMPT